MSGFKRVVHDLPDNIAARVDGIEITEDKVIEEIAPMLVQLNRDYADREHDGEYLHSQRIIRGRAIERLITLALVDREMKKHNIVITPEQVDKHIEESSAANGMTVEDLKNLVTSRNKQSFEQWKKLAQYDKRLGIMELVELQYSEDLNVSESDAHAFYQKHHKMFERPEQVRVSHILIETRTSAPNVDPNQVDTRAREKAEDLLRQIRGGADFARLAEEYSDCPSSKNGGDLGFGTSNSWVSAFSQAAFSLQVGQVSDVVKSRYGYHIIKVTDRQQASETPFEEVKEEMIERMKDTQKDRLRVKYIELLRDKAKTEYAPGNLITMLPRLKP
jgi:peptidyl-prolyl cis-trans isomerase C